MSSTCFTHHHSMAMACATLSSSVTMAPVTSFTPVFAVMVTSGMTTSIATTTSDPAPPKTSVAPDISRSKTVMTWLDRGSVGHLEALGVILEQGWGRGLDVPGSRGCAILWAVNYLTCVWFVGPGCRPALSIGLQSIMKCAGGFEIQELEILGSSFPVAAML